MAHIQSSVKHFLLRSLWVHKSPLMSLKLKWSANVATPEIHKPYETMYNCLDVQLTSLARAQRSHYALPEDALTKTNMSIMGLLTRRSAAWQRCWGRVRRAIKIRQRTCRWTDTAQTCSGMFWNNVCRNPKMLRAIGSSGHRKAATNSMSNPGGE